VVFRPEGTNHFSPMATPWVKCSIIDIFALKGQLNISYSEQIELLVQGADKMYYDL
jgi:hypothetical protein